MAAQLVHGSGATRTQDPLVKLIYAAGAIGDLARLRSFISQHDPSAAARIAASLIAKIEHLRRFPHSGRRFALSPEPQTIRDVIFGKDIVRHLPTHDAIIVLRVWHHREGSSGSVTHSCY